MLYPTMSRIFHRDRIALRTGSPPRFVLVVLVFFAGTLCSLVAERMRMSLSVTPRTIVPPSAANSTRGQPARIQALVVAVSNDTSRQASEGKIAWTVLVRKVAGGIVKYSGSEFLPPLRPSQTEEMQFGSFEAAVIQTATSVERDRVEYDVIVSHDGQEVARKTSCANFAALELQAVAANGAGDFADGKKRKARPPRDGEMQPPLIAKPAEPAPPSKPAAPARPEIVKPPVETPVPQQPFDFFNLGGKTAPVAK